MGAIYELSFWRHPMRVTTLAFRAWVLRGLRELQLQDDAAGFASDVLPPGLEQFSVGEVLPWKGVKFRVGKVVGGALPCVILVPTDMTTGAKLRALRAFRDRKEA